MDLKHDHARDKELERLCRHVFEILDLNMSHVDAYSEASEKIRQCFKDVFVMLVSERNCERDLAMRLMLAAASMETSLLAATRDAWQQKACQAAR